MAKENDSGETETLGKHPPTRWQLSFTTASEPIVFPANHCRFFFKDPCFIGSAIKVKTNAE